MYTYRIIYPEKPMIRPRTLFALRYGPSTDGHVALVVAAVNFKMGSDPLLLGTPERGTEDVVDWAVYIGATKDPEALGREFFEARIELVAHYGLKVPKEIGCAFYPALPEDKYRP